MRQTLTIILSILILSSGCSTPEDKSPEKPIAVVTLAPFATFVKRIAGDRVEVIVLIPPGADPHSWSPTPREAGKVQQAEVWFRLGETGERQIVQSLQQRSDGPQLVDLRTHVTLITGNHCPHCSHAEEDFDPHIWLSVREAQTMSKTIAESLISLHPEWQQEIQNNLSQWQQELQAADDEIAREMAHSRCHVVLTSHPALGYFARDYGIHQLSIEQEGREPTPSHLNELLVTAREEGVRCIIVQPQRSYKGAQRLAQQVGAEIYLFDPMDENYPSNLIDLAKKLRQSPEEA